MDSPTDRLEARVADLLRMCDDLSDTVARQATRIETLERRVELLMRREAEREAQDPGAEVLADQPPPHW